MNRSCPYEVDYCEVGEGLCPDCADDRMAEADLRRKEQYEQRNRQ